jgi:hypothetical protein
MLSELPADIQHGIYARLHVRDKVSLRLALPKQVLQNLNADVAHEKKLGILHKAITKKVLQKLTPSIKCFLASCDKEDPAFQEIAEVFPEVQNTSYKSIFEKIRDGSLTVEDIEYVSIQPEDFNNKTHLKDAIYSCKPPVFQILMQNDVVKNYLLCNSYFFFLSLFKLCNTELIEHILQSYNEYGFDLEHMKILTKASIMGGVRSIILEKFVRQTILKYLDFTNDDLCTLAMYCLEHMDVEGYESFQAA